MTLPALVLAVGLCATAPDAPLRAPEANAVAYQVEAEPVRAIAPQAPFSSTTSFAVAMAPFGLGVGLMIATSIGTFSGSSVPSSVVVALFSLGSTLTLFGPGLPYLLTREYWDFARSALVRGGIAGLTMLLTYVTVMLAPFGVLPLLVFVGGCASELTALVLDAKAAWDAPARWRELHRPAGPGEPPL